MGENRFPVHDGCMRLFIGIPLSPEVLKELAAIPARLRRPDDELRWSTPESWHITLQFLGNTTPEQCTCITAGLHAIRCAPVAIHLEGLGFFDRAGVFFADVPPTPELVDLQKKVTAATQPCGFEPEDRPYHSHITLARNKGRGNGIRALKPRVGAAPRFSSFVAGEFLLYESFPGPKGSRYEVRERFALAAP